MSNFESKPDGIHVMMSKDQKLAFLIALRPPRQNMLRKFRHLSPNDRDRQGV